VANFSAADAEDLFSKIRSIAKGLAVFPAVIGHDPENAPPAGMSCSIMLGPVKPVTSSGLDSVSCQVTLMVHVWNFASKRPLDDVDPQVLAATCSLMGAFAGGFTLGETVREVDLFAMDAQPGYVNFEGKEFRTVAIAVPIEINDLFEEVALWRLAHHPLACPARRVFHPPGSLRLSLCSSLVAQRQLPGS